MSKAPQQDETEPSEAETAKRRDEVIRRMANTKPKPHDQKNDANAEPRPKPPQE